ncbi:unnamed protein product [Caretta caretta]
MLADHHSYHMDPVALISCARGLEGFSRQVIRWPQTAVKLGKSCQLKFLQGWSLSSGILPVEHREQFQAIIMEGQLLARTSPQASLDTADTAIHSISTSSSYEEGFLVPVLQISERVLYNNGTRYDAA